jgi:Skp family chaperone for outer membrane proteins
VDKDSEAAGREGELQRNVRKLSNSYKEVQMDLERGILDLEEQAKQAKSEQERRALIALCQSEREADRAACQNRRAEIIEEIERLAPDLCDNITKHEVGKKVQYVLIYN